jgi:ATP-dependent RNA helicase DDX56/DBP9
MRLVSRCSEADKFLYLFAIFHRDIKLVKGKCLIFVDNLERCYFLKLYLEQFHTRCCILNSELPVSSRIHVVEEFNKGVYDIIIASDEREVLGSENLRLRNPSKAALERNGDELAGQASVAGQDIDEDEEEANPRKKRKFAGFKSKDKEYGISRGIDFKNVACVLNFDLPISARSYTHRIGRTARAGKTGMALSFVVPRSEYRKHKPTSIPSTEHDEQHLAEIAADQETRRRKRQAKPPNSTTRPDSHGGANSNQPQPGLPHDFSSSPPVLQPYEFAPSAVDPLRYRTMDVLKRITGIAVREARTREIRNELLRSDRLRAHFEENPADLRHLRHDGQSHALRVSAHLKHVPDYLLPAGAAASKQGGGSLASSTGTIGFVGFHKDGRRDGGGKNSNQNKGSRAGRGGRMARGGAKRRMEAGRSRSDPLKTFKAKRK